MRKIGAVTTSRSDYSSLMPVMRIIDADPDLRLLLFVGGNHLSPKFGLTVKEIEADGFAITDRIDTQNDSDTPQDISKAMGRGVTSFTDSLVEHRPDIIVIVGDRFELLSVVCAALPLGIPVAHISGGDLTVGAIDNQVRHAITKMSHLHFPDMPVHGDRLIQMGEEPHRVTVTGDPALDLVRQMNYLDRTQLGKALGLALESPLILVSFHPTTLGSGNVADEADNLLKALARVTGTLVFSYPNADSHNQIIVSRMKDFVGSRPGSGLFFNLGQRQYYSLMAIADLIVGNSSSAIFEAPSFHLPAVNIGDRQGGRLRERNVIDVCLAADEILLGIQQGLEPSFRDSLQDLRNPYGDGEAAPRIVQVLKTVELGPQLLRKSFVDFSVATREAAVGG